MRKAGVDRRPFFVRGRYSPDPKALSLRTRLSTEDGLPLAGANGDARSLRWPGEVQWNYPQPVISCSRSGLAMDVDGARM